MENDINASIILINANMNNEIIKKYGINFQNRVDDGIIDKIPNCNPGYLNFLLYEWSASEIIDNDHGLLSDIDEALADPNSEIEAGSSTVDIIIYQDIVQFYPTGDDEVYSMPTTDFREIVVGWKDFLLQSPLNGSRA